MELKKLMWNSSLCLFGLFVLSIRNVSAHPQCLDSRPPFDSESQLSFCPQYQKFGCCTLKDDGDIQVRYERMRAKVPVNLWRQCSSYVKTFLCQTCSPYAAHIFDAEKPNQLHVIPRKFPGLCLNECSKFYDRCKDIVEYFFDQPTEESRTLAAAIAASPFDPFTFCKAQNLSDYDYCYPDLLTHPMLTGNISNKVVTQEGCMCVERFQNTRLRNPIFAKHADDRTNRLFIGEQVGLIHIFYPDGKKLSEPFLDMRDLILTTNWKGDERGMLGLAFHPKFATNGLFYVYYSTSLTVEEAKIYRFNESGRIWPYNHKIVVTEFKVSSQNPNKAAPRSEHSRQIIQVPQPYPNHNGGEILFGPDDGYLYLFVGDGGKAGDPFRAGQDLTTLLGKVLRIDVDDYIPGYTSYSIPPDNPFNNYGPLPDGTYPLPEIYAYGVRNIWRCGIDRGDPNKKGPGGKRGAGWGRIFCGDVGQSAVEEIDQLQKGANYGWNNLEGTHDYCTTCRKVSETIGPLVDPIFEYTHSSGYGKSITGGNFYRGCHSPNLNGMYFFGDFMSGRLFRLLENQQTKQWEHKEVTMCGDFYCNGLLSNQYAPSIISFGEDEDGEVYMLSTWTPAAKTYEGEIYRLVDPFRRGNPATCRSARPHQTTPGPTQPTTPTTTTTARTTDSVSGPRQQYYLDYYRRQKLRNERRKLQRKYAAQRQNDNLVQYKTEPPQRSQATLTLHGLAITRCTNYPQFWCTLNRLRPYR